MAQKGSIEWRNNISKGRKGQPSPKYWLGKKHDEDYKRRMSLSLSGEKNPRFGVKVEPETKHKISESVKNWYIKHGTEHLKGKRPKTSLALRGRKHNDETRRKLSYYAKLRVGEKSGGWKGGITPVNTSIRNSEQFKEWSVDVKKVWDYTCQICGQRGGKLESNHIKKFSDHQELRFEITNGIVLCEECHQRLVNQHETEWESYFNFCWDLKQGKDEDFVYYLSI